MVVTGSILTAATVDCVCCVLQAALLCKGLERAKLPMVVTVAGSVVSAHMEGLCEVSLAAAAAAAAVLLLHQAGLYPSLYIVSTTCTTTAGVLGVLTCRNAATSATSVPTQLSEHAATLLAFPALACVRL
jgi:hypothetical protein